MSQESGDSRHCSVVQTLRGWPGSGQGGESPAVALGGLEQGEIWKGAEEEAS